MSEPWTPSVGGNTIDEARAEIERLTMALEMFMRDEKTAAQNVRMLRAEIERLTGQCDEYRAAFLREEGRADKLGGELDDKEAEVGRLRALLRPIVDMVAEPEDFAAARRALGGKE